MEHTYNWNIKTFHFIQHQLSGFTSTKIFTYLKFHYIFHNQKCKFRSPKMIHQNIMKTEKSLHSELPLKPIDFAYLFFALYLVYNGYGLLMKINGIIKYCITPSTHIGVMNKQINITYNLQRHFTILNKHHHPTKMYECPQ